MTLTTPTRSADPGTPPPGIEQALSALYSPVTPAQETAPPAQAPEPPVIEALVPHVAAPMAAKTQDSLSETERRVLRRLHDASATLTIRVNGVELTLDIVDVNRSETSICCLVKQNGLRCKIPRSESVEIELEGKTYKTAFLGSWHTLEWLGVHVVVFPVLPDEEDG